MDQSNARIAANDLKQRLSGGLIPATPVPFDSAGKLHERAHDSYLRYMSEQAIAGVAVWAHTGRGLLLDDETAQRVLHDWRDALTDKILIAGVGASCDPSDFQHATTSTLRMADRAIKGSADALLVYAPTWLRGHEYKEKLIVEHHSLLSQ